MVRVIPEILKNAEVSELSLRWPSQVMVAGNRNNQWVGPLTGGMQPAKKLVKKRVEQLELPRLSGKC